MHKAHRWRAIGDPLLEVVLWQHLECVCGGNKWTKTVKKTEK